LTNREQRLCWYWMDERINIWISLPFPPRPWKSWWNFYAGRCDSWMTGSPFWITTQGRQKEYEDMTLANRNSHLRQPDFRSIAYIINPFLVVDLQWVEHLNQQISAKDGRLSSLNPSLCSICSRKRFPSLHFQRAEVTDGYSGTSISLIKTS
jgi:hypothetical protein